MARFRTVFLLISLLSAATGTILAQDGEDSVVAEPYAIEGIVDALSLLDTDGQEYGLHSFSDADGVILIFTGNTCPCAEGYETRINWLDKTYKAKGWPVLAVNSNKAERQHGDGFEDMKQQALEGSWTYPYLIDEDQELAKAYGALRTPHAFVLQRVGEDFKLIYEGAIDNRPYDAYRVTRHYVAEVIEAAIKGNRPPIRQVPPAGCAIEGISELPRECPIESKIARKVGQQ